MKRWYATLPPATRNRNIQLSFKRNLDEVPVAPETHGLQSDIETVCFSGSIWIYAKQDLCDHHHDHHHDDHHHDDHHHHHRHRHRHPHHHPHPHPHPHHHHHHHQQQQQQQQQQPNRTRTCILQKATPNVNRQLNMLGIFSSGTAQTSHQQRLTGDIMRKLHWSPQMSLPCFCSWGILT